MNQIQDRKSYQPQDIHDANTPMRVGENPIERIEKFHSVYKPKQLLEERKKEHQQHRAECRRDAERGMCFALRCEKFREERERV